MSNKKSGLALGGLIAAVTGFVAGILLAPKSGKQTRQDIKKTAHQVSESTTAEVKKLQTNLSRLITKAETSLKQATKTTATSGRNLVDKAQQTKTNLADVAKALKAGKAKDKDLDQAVKQAKLAAKSLTDYLKK